MKLGRNEKCHCGSDIKYKKCCLQKDADKVKKYGEVFTPTELVKEMLGKLPDECWNPGKTSLDPACGNGQFLEEVFEKKVFQNETDNPNKHRKNIENALSTTYGIEIQPKWVLVCRHRLFQDAVDMAPKNTKPATFIRWLDIVTKNIICADALKLGSEFTHSDWKNANRMPHPSPFCILVQEKGEDWKVGLDWEKLQRMVQYEDNGKLDDWLESSLIN